MERSSDASARQLPEERICKKKNINAVGNSAQRNQHKLPQQSHGAKKKSSVNMNGTNKMYVSLCM